MKRQQMCTNQMNTAASCAEAVYSCAKNMNTAAMAMIMMGTILLVSIFVMFGMIARISIYILILALFINHLQPILKEPNR